jgi:segregation and condensation protein A
MKSLSHRYSASRPESLQSPTTVDYRVQLDVYNGPLDLLLYLIRRDELDIHDIPIASITETYMLYVRKLREDATLDINSAGEFLVLAATLMEIKSATLLPAPPPDAAGGAAANSAAAELSDPRADLVRQLLEYKRFKDTARMLEHRQREHANRFARQPGGLPGSDEPPPLDIEEVQIWDLLEAFSTLMQEVGSRGPSQHEVLSDETPQELHAADIEDRVKRDGRVTLRDLIVGRASKAEMIGVFLALLELVRQRRVSLGTSDGVGIEVLPPLPESEQPKPE